MKRATTTVCIAGAIAAISASPPAFAQTAGMMSFQGLIRDSGGFAAQGAITLQLQIVDAGNTVLDASGNGSVGAEDTFVVNTTAEQGIVSLKYGPIAPLAFNGSQRFLKVTVTSPGGYPALTPVEIVTPPAIAEQINARGTGNAVLVALPSGNVGIGTLSPASPLTVSGNSANTEFRVENVSGGGHAWGFLSSGATAGTGPGFLRINDFTAGVDRLVISPAGQVGIGTVSPDYPLEVSGSGPNGGRARFISTNAANGIIVRGTDSGTSDTSYVNLEDPQGRFTIGLTGVAAGGTGGDLRVTTDVAEAMRIIRSTRFVGLGTTTPNERLTVAGSAALDGSNNFFYARPLEGSNAEATSLGFASAVGGVLTLSNNGANDIRAGRASTGGQLRFFVNNTAAPTAPSNGTEALTIDAVGRIGIGVPSPARQIDFASSGQQEMVFRRSDAAANQRAWRFSNGGGSFAFEAVNDALTGGVNILSILRDGTVGFGRSPTGAGAWRIEVEGAAFKTAGGADWNVMSDRRIKTDIQPVEDALERLSKVRLHTFRYTDEYRAAHPTLEDRRQMNVIAQEFRDVFPEYVSESGETLSTGERILYVDPWPLTIYGVAATQELHKLVLDQSTDAEQQRATIERQQAELDAQRQQLDRQATQIADLLARLERLEQVNRATGAESFGSTDQAQRRTDAQHPHYAQPLGEKR